MATHGNDGDATMEFVLGPNGSMQEKPPETAAGNGDLIKESDTANFTADVIEASMKVPVIVDFWAPWCNPCKQLTPMLEKLVRQAGGLVRLVKVNVDENQPLAAQVRVQSIPTVYAFKNGQPVDGFVGAQPESQIRALIAKLTAGEKTPAEVALEQADAALEAGDAEGANAVYQEILARDPAHPGATAGMIRAAVALGQTAEARALADALPDAVKKDSAVAAALSALELAEQSDDAGDADEFRRKLEADENDHQARFDLAVSLFGAGDNEQALEELLELFKRDRAWNDEAARKQMVKMFDALGASHPLTVEGRQRLSAMLFS